MVTPKNGLSHRGVGHHPAAVEPSRRAARAARPVVAETTAACEVRVTRSRRQARQRRKVARPFGTRQVTGRCFWRLTDPLLKLMGGSMQMRFHCERALDREGQLMLQMAELWVARDVSNLRVVWHRRQHNAQPFDVANVAGVRGGDRGGLNCEGTLFAGSRRNTAGRRDDTWWTRRSLPIGAEDRKQRPDIHENQVSKTADGPLSSPGSFGGLGLG